MTQRQAISRELDRASGQHQAVAERATYVERWRKDNAAHLKKSAGNAVLEIAEIARWKVFGDGTPRVIVTVTNTTTSTILRLRREKAVFMADSFGNFYRLAEWKDLGGAGRRGIRPGQTDIFQFEFADTPLETSRFVRIYFEPDALGQSQSVNFQIPIEVFIEGMIDHS